MVAYKCTEVTCPCTKKRLRMLVASSAVQSKLPDGSHETKYVSMVPQGPRESNGQAAKAVVWWCHPVEEYTVDLTHAVATEEPPLSSPYSPTEPSFPSQVPCYASDRYLSLLLALFDGLLEYDTARGGFGHAPTPLSAA